MGAEYVSSSLVAKCFERPNENVSEEWDKKSLMPRDGVGCDNMTQEMFALTS